MSIVPRSTWRWSSGIPYGGWCPRGGWAEDLPVPPGLLARYPRLRETPTAAPAQRTRWNVRDSDATLILVTGVAASGLRHGADARARRGARAAGGGRGPRRWRRTRAGCGAARCLPRGSTLNVAGPRESGVPGIYARSRELLAELLAGCASLGVTLAGGEAVPSGGASARAGACRASASAMACAAGRSTSASAAGCATNRTVRSRSTPRERRTRCRACSTTSARGRAAPP